EKWRWWPGEAKREMTALQQAASGENPRSAAPQVAFLRNVLARVPDYRQSLNAVKTPAEFVGEPFMTFIKLPSPRSEPAPPDMAMTFEAQPIANVPEGSWNWIGAIPLNAEGNSSIVVGNTREVQIIGGPKLNFPGRTLTSADALSAQPYLNSVLPIAFNYDFKTDFVLAGSDGVRFYQQSNAGDYTDVTALTRLPDSITRQTHSSLW